MSRVSRVLRQYDGGYMHWCPGCRSLHMIAVSEPFPNSARWSFDGDVEQPTFAPSIRVNYNGPDADTQRGGGERAPSACCHYFLTAGMLQFCSDSTHELSGKIVPLPDLPVSAT